MGAILMDDVYVEENSLIAAGAVVSKGTRIKSGEVWAGVPAKKIKDIDASLLDGEINRISSSYNMYASWYGNETE
jgi:carbonic anhydrase/acetyltransferase-like protein (isoleucine patch superfamily)